MPTVGKFAVLLREGREAAGLTQAALAQRCHLTGSYISLLESGRKPPPSDKVVLRLAKALSLDPARALEVAHLDRAPADLRKALEAFQRRERIEGALRRETADLLIPLASVWRLFAEDRSPPGLRRTGASNLDPEVVLAIEALQEAARDADDIEEFHAASRRILARLTPAHRRSLLEAAPLLDGGGGGGGTGTFLAAAPEPGLPPDIRPGDTLVVDPGLAPGAGDAVLAGGSGAPRLARFEPGLEGVRGVVVEVRRRMRRPS